MPLRHATSSDVILFAVTRGLLGTGIGLLVAGRLPERRRRIIANVLTTIGVASTIPLALRLFKRNRPEAVEHDPYLYNWAD